jgi:hypothetical protein
MAIRGLSFPAMLCVVLLATDAAAQSFTYVGQVVRGGERYAVVMRDGAADLMHVGETIDGYRLQSIAERELVVVEVKSGAVRTLALGTVATSSPAAKPAAAGSPALRLAGPAQAAIGEHFTMMVILGPSAADGDTVAVRFDPKVLQPHGAEADGASDGEGWIEISVASGDKAVLQFRVVAPRPTSTEISATVDERRATHRVSIVPASAPGEAKAGPRYGH